MLIYQAISYCWLNIMWKRLEIILIVCLHFVLIRKSVILLVFDVFSNWLKFIIYFIIHYLYGDKSLSLCESILMVFALDFCDHCVCVICLICMLLLIFVVIAHAVNNFRATHSSSMLFIIVYSYSLFFSFFFCYILC